MFDRDALELIQKTAIRAAEPVLAFDGRAVAIPEGTNLASAEQWADGRFRFRGNYTTTALAEFLSYTLARSGSHGHGTGPATVFVDGENARARAFFNLGTPGHPGHADDVAHLSLRGTTAYTELLQAANQQLTQKQLAEFLEDWFDHAVPDYPIGDEPHRASLTAAIAAIRDITVTASAETNSVERDLARSNSAFAQVEAKSRNQLPAGFLFTCSPYDGFEARTFRLRLAVRPNGDKAPALVLRIVGLGDTKDQIALEFEAKVRAALEGVPVYRGSFTP